MRIKRKIPSCKHCKKVSDLTCSDISGYYVYYSYGDGDGADGDDGDGDDGDGDDGDEVR
jgi:hypothetical protein